MNPEIPMMFALALLSVGMWTLRVAVAARGLKLAGAELRRDRVERDAVAGPLHQAGLTGADHHGVETVIAERSRQDRGGRAFADRAVGPEDGDARAIDLGDPAVHLLGEFVDGLGQIDHLREQGEGDAHLGLRFGGAPLTGRWSDRAQRLMT